MKYILFLCYLISIQSKSQDCETLDQLSFHGIKLREKMPDTLSWYFKKDTLDQNISYTMMERLTDYNAWIGFKPIFKFRSVFEMISFDCIHDKRIFQVGLVKEWDNKNPIQFSKDTFPIFYQNALDELLYLFGNPTIKNDISKDASGINVGTYWVCENTEIALSYKSKGKKSWCYLWITNSELEKIHKLESVQK